MIAQTKIIDFLLRLAGIGLAGGSLYLALRMTMAPSPVSGINGREFLSIYAKPKTPILAARRSSISKGIDFTPIGSLPAARSDLLLLDFELIDASANVATIRTAHGRILRVSPGSFLPGGGRVLVIQWSDGRWRVRTTRGWIAQF